MQGSRDEGRNFKDLKEKWRCGLSKGRRRGGGGEKGRDKKI